MRLLTVDQTADRFGVKVSTIRRWLVLRKIAQIKLSRRAVRVSETEVERLIRENTIPALEDHR
jgi:excisionase family DNA binding protein